MNKASLKFEKLFSTYINDIGETPGGFFSFFSWKDIEEGDLKKIGRQLQIGADILENRLGDMEFQLYEYEKGKTESRLKAALNTLRKMGKEMENMEIKEPKEYHWYIIALTMDIISSLFNHIEIYYAEHSR